MSISRLSPQELSTFIEDMINNKIFCLHHIREEEMLRMGSMVFMPIAFGAKFSPEEEQNIGTIYEYWDQAGPRSINGYPCFFSMRVLHKDDWDLAKVEILKEQAAQKARKEERESRLAQAVAPASTEEGKTHD